MIMSSVVLIGRLRNLEELKIYTRESHGCDPIYTVEVGLSRSALAFWITQIPLPEGYPYIMHTCA